MSTKLQDEIKERLMEKVHETLKTKEIRPRCRENGTEWGELTTALQTLEILPQKEDQPIERCGTRICIDRQSGTRKRNLKTTWTIDGTTCSESFGDDSLSAWLKSLFTASKKETSCLSFAMYCFRCMRVSHVLLNQRKTDVNEHIEVVLKWVCQNRSPSVFVVPVEADTAVGARSLSFEEWLSRESGWNISVDEAVKESMISYWDAHGSQDSRNTLFENITALVFRELERTPFGEYLADKIRMTSAPDAQAVNFIKAFVDIKIRLCAVKQADPSASVMFVRAVTQSESEEKWIRISVSIPSSFLRAAVRYVQNDLERIGEGSECYTAEDYIRVLYAIARGCRESKEHTVSLPKIKMIFSKLFGDQEVGVYFALPSGGDCPNILTEILQHGIIKKRESGEFSYSNKLFRVCIDGMGTALYAEDESMIDFILSQNTSKKQLNHLDLDFESLTVFAKAYLENSKRKDQVILRLISEAEDFDVRNRFLQASCVHILSAILLDSEYLMTGRLRNRAFITVFGKNAYPLQQEIAKRLFQRTYYRECFNHCVAESLKVAENGCTKGEPLFFYYAFLQDRSKTDAVIEPCGTNRECVERYHRSLALASRAWGEKLPSHEEYVKLLGDVVSAILTEAMFLNSKESAQSSDALLRSFHTGEHLLYSIADLLVMSPARDFVSDLGAICSDLKLSKEECLNRLIEYAVRIDYFKRKTHPKYGTGKWDGTSYMTCGSTRFLAALGDDILKTAAKVVLTDSQKLDYLRWLEQELRMAYDSSSLRYVIFMIRLLNCMDMDMKWVRNVILMPNTMCAILHGDAEDSTKKDQIDALTPDFFLVKNGKRIEDSPESICRQKEKFRRCFEATCFLEYDSFSEDLDRFSRRYGLTFSVANRLENIDCIAASIVKYDDAASDGNEDRRCAFFDVGTQSYILSFCDKEIILTYKAKDSNISKQFLPTYEDISIRNASVAARASARWSDNGRHEARSLTVGKIIGDAEITMHAQILSEKERAEY